MPSHAEHSTMYGIGESDQRPWGDWTVLDAGPGYAVKRIRVRPGGRLSLQRHAHREERWTVASGLGRATLGENVMDIRPGETVAIGPRMIHRLENPGAAWLVLIEVQLGALLAEHDIERIEDEYGRAPDRGPA